MYVKYKSLERILAVRPPRLWYLFTIWYNGNVVRWMDMGLVIILQSLECACVSFIRCWCVIFDGRKSMSRSLSLTKQNILECRNCKDVAVCFKKMLWVGYFWMKNIDYAPFDGATDRQNGRKSMTQNSMCKYKTLLLHYILLFW